MDATTEMMDSSSQGEYVYEKILIFEKVDGSETSVAVIITPPGSDAHLQPGAAFDDQGRLTPEWGPIVWSAVFYSGPVDGGLVWSEIQYVEDRPEGSEEVALEGPHEYVLGQFSPPSSILGTGTWMLSAGVLRTDAGASRMEERVVSWNAAETLAYVTDDIVSPDPSLPSIVSSGDSVNDDGPSTPD
ncbi:hypothetical protein CB0940_06965 [Cercospora beticola]|uniref:Uncharacterized protein n=1 Tax=Cercospora beticola TaxID=122368 RepID=A0A2G5H9W6_CERBT|nr:hypothetical protein CB0940_06965 [Cercospora beticola]PIA89324.1 hypothetical protein CB0940_06965 [Cercospora beticola]WPB02883.1 hypothetical protein RHO25_007519 [Cercospora beticola]CAK1358421.1 unnamed protein product [Cercospora beticola]